MLPRFACVEHHIIIPSVLLSFIFLRREIFLSPYLDTGADSAFGIQVRRILYCHRPTPVAVCSRQEYGGETRRSKHALTPPELFQLKAALHPAVARCACEHTTMSSPHLTDHTERLALLRR